MRPVAPRVLGYEDCEVTLAEEQEDYAPITALPLLDGAKEPPPHIGWLSRWRPSAAERKAIAEGADIYVATMSCYFAPMQVTADPATLLHRDAS